MNDPMLITVVMRGTADQEKGPVLLNCKTGTGFGLEAPNILHKELHK